MKTYFILGLISPILFAIGIEIYWILVYGFNETEGFVKYLFYDEDGNFKLTKNFEFTWLYLIYAITFWPINIMMKCNEFNKLIDSYYKEKEQK